MILDNIGIKAMLITGTVVCAVGVVIVSFAFADKGKRDKQYDM